MLHVVSAVKWKLWLQSFTPELSNPGHGLRKKQHLSLFLDDLGQGGHRGPRAGMDPQGHTSPGSITGNGTKCSYAGTPEPGCDMG